MKRGTMTGSRILLVHAAALFLTLISSTIESVRAFSIPTDSLESSNMSRRSQMDFLLRGITSMVLVGGAPTALAEDSTTTTTPTTTTTTTIAHNQSTCQTSCIYECEQRSLQFKKHTNPTELAAGITKDCLEQCNDDRQKCDNPAPARVREPILQQAKDIRGLYPRWQDGF